MHTYNKKIYIDYVYRYSSAHFEPQITFSLTIEVKAYERINNVKFIHFKQSHLSELERFKGHKY